MTKKKKILHKDLEKNRGSYTKWCIINFGEAFLGWLHLKCIQTYVESILRFGLPPEFQAMLLVPKKGHERKLEKKLCEFYSYLGEDFGNEEDVTDEKSNILLGQEKFFPYVWSEIDIDFSVANK